MGKIDIVWDQKIGPLNSRWQLPAIDKVFAHLLYIDKDFADSENTKEKCILWIGIGEVVPGLVLRTVLWPVTVDKDYGS